MRRLFSNLSLDYSAHGRLRSGATYLFGHTPSTLVGFDPRHRRWDPAGSLCRGAAGLLRHPSELCMAIDFGLVDAAALDGVSLRNPWTVDDSPGSLPRDPRHHQSGNNAAGNCLSNPEQTLFVNLCIASRRSYLAAVGIRSAIGGGGLPFLAKSDACIGSAFFGCFVHFFVFAPFFMDGSYGPAWNRGMDAVAVRLIPICKKFFPGSRPGFSKN